MQKKIRQYAALLFAVAAYYIVHEGAHLLYALQAGVFEGIRFTAVGVQVQIAAKLLTPQQLGIFCCVGPAAALSAGWLLAAASRYCCGFCSKLVRACFFYTTAALLFTDPLYLAFLSGFFGGGDMNGIALLVPPAAAKAFFCVLLVCGAVLFFKRVLPQYSRSFSES